MLEEALIDKILDVLGYKIEPWEAEELAESLMRLIEEHILNELRG